MFDWHKIPILFASQSIDTKGGVCIHTPDTSDGVKYDIQYWSIPWYFKF